MIAVVGGVYVERCVQPIWNHLYGSGGRAAAALSALTTVDLTTWVDDRNRPRLETLASGFGFSLHAEREPATISFDYVHPLSVPVILPPPHLLTSRPALKVHHEAVLRFGMLQGDAVVSGKRVTYDPQSAYDPQLFRKNGSSADALAIVLNAYELRLLTGLEDVPDGARTLLALDGADVVVVKRGSKGALAVTASNQVEVPAYLTESVFSIGSGDIFASAFSYFWGEQGIEPVTAAHLSSRATARYCESKSISMLPRAELEVLPLEAVQPKPGRVYLAGPFFTLPQRWLIEEARSHLLSMRLRVFSPFHDVGIGPAHVVAPADIEALDSCDRMLALADGGDAGTLFEIGYARAKGLPVVVLAEAVPEEQMKMIRGSKCVVSNDFATALYRTAWVR